MSREKKNISSESQEDHLEMTSQKLLSKEEISQMETVWKRLRKRQSENKPEAADTFELMYLGFLSNIKNRKVVEKDLKELKRMLDGAATKMMEILEKSQGPAYYKRGRSVSEADAKGASSNSGGKLD